MASLWIGAVALSAVVLVLLLWPLLRRAAVENNGSSHSQTIAFYKSQMAEIERERDQGQISPEEAAAAIREVQRRLLSATGKMEGASPSSSNKRAVSLAFLVVLVVLGGAFGLYKWLGRPDLPALPLEGRQAKAPVPDPTTLPPEQRQAMIEGMVASLAARLENEPDNVEGWLRLARSYLVLGREEEAIAAYNHVLSRHPEAIPVLLLKARALRGLAGNRPTVETEQLMTRVLDLDPEQPEALWFTAMAALRKGDREKARNLFAKALAALPEEDRAELAAQVKQLLEGQE